MPEDLSCVLDRIAHFRGFDLAGPRRDEGRIAGRARYLAERAATLSSQLPPLADSAEAWQKQPAELVKDLSGLLGMPPREPMKAAVTYTKEDGDLLIEEVAYLWAEKVYVSATVIRSKGAKGRQPAVVMPSGWLGHYTFLPYRKCVDALARSGCTVLFIDDPRTGRRQAPFAGLYVAASAAGTQPIAIQVFDALRGLDYLTTRADIDPGPNRHRRSGRGGDSVVAGRGAGATIPVRCGRRGSCDVPNAHCTASRWRAGTGRPVGFCRRPAPLHGP